MQFISCHNGKLQTLETGLKTSPARSFVTGLEALDAVAPQGALSRGAVHELLFDPAHAQPKFVAALFASAASYLLPPPPGEGGGEGEYQNARTSTFALTLPSPGGRGEDVQPIIWSDPRGEFYPPALASFGLDLKHLYLLRPQTDADESWAITEALRCRGVGAVVAAPSRLSRIVARRLQLAAEHGGSVGILLRPRDKSASVYAAATRWLVAPCPGERTIQRWKIQLLHGHGGRIGQAVFLELCRETNSLRALEKLPDRQVAAPSPRKIA